MFGRKIALTTVVSTPKITSDNTETTKTPVDIENLILTLEGAIARSACVVGLVIVGVVAAKSVFRTCDTVVAHVYK
jgi:type IV secretory pathway VirB2 component (pilin)